MMETARVKKLLQTLTQQDNDTFYLKIVDMDLRTKFIECEVSESVTFALHTGIYFDDPIRDELQKFMIFVNKNLIESCVDVLAVIAPDRELIFLNKTGNDPEDEEIVVSFMDLTIAPMPFLPVFETLRMNRNEELAPCYYDVEWLLNERDKRTAAATRFVTDMIE